MPVYYIMLALNIIFRPMPVDLTGFGWSRYILFFNQLLPAYDAEWNSFAGLWTINIFVVYYLLVPLLSKVCTTCKKTTILWLVLAFCSVGLLKGMEVVFKENFMTTCPLSIARYLECFRCF